MTKLTNSGLVEHCLRTLQMKTVYCWGSFGQKVTPAFVEGRRLQYPKYYSDKRIQYLNSLVGYIGCDCVGLIKWYYWQGKYNAKTDVNCTGMYNLAKKKGPINTLPEKPGIVLYKKGHVGVYIGHGKAVECTLSGYGDGCVTSNVKGRGWTHWLQCPFIEDDSVSPDTIIKKVIEDKLNNNITIPEPKAADDVKPRRYNFDMTKLPHRPRKKLSLLSKILKYLK